MKELIKYIATILNIKIDNHLVVHDIENELKSIEDITSYQKFIRKNLDYHNMSYFTGFQKFIKLTELYKQKVLDYKTREELLAIPSKAKVLADKVKAVTITFLESEHKRQHLGYTHKELDFKSFKEYFTKDDISTFLAIGTLKACVSMQNQRSGENGLLLEIERVLKSQLAKSQTLITTE